MEDLFLGYRVPKQTVAKSVGGHINVDRMDEQTFRRLFHFCKDELPVLTDVLKIQTIRCSHKASPYWDKKPFRWGLRRLAYPNRWWDLEPIFGRQSSALFNIVSQLFHHIDGTFGHLLADVNNHSWLTLSDLEQYSEIST
ncbi:hypothetical protein HPB52_007871 [Rhipicephalus sanguineus]|uniref:Uncharacterized protein n=1 Tax=Rhipicephalus sanguineus TaxID=34632 RepID=A0A9D4QHC1_RHISA|nr:hypothetical protein HPB52_007871 [Rhipicephalus sanguineus]